MRDILDPAALWIGVPGTVSFFGDKAPVAVDDALTLLKDSGAVIINVLSNDFDPEGGALTLVSAYAALGTAVAEADGTVTYTPLPGVSGFDTVVYEISDIQGQIRSGQVNVTITEPQLSIATLPDNTMTLTAGNGILDITISEPAEFAGTYQIDVGDLQTGPVNLVPPGISGTIAVGEILTAASGLWVYDLSAPAPVTGWQWLRGPDEIAGETAATYMVQSGDSMTGIALRQTEASTLGQRNAVSAVTGGAFTPLDDPALLGWWDASDTNTIVSNGNAVTGWADKTGGAALGQTNTVRRPQTGQRTLNGLNVIDFNGDQFLERSETLPSSGDVSFHMVLAIDSVSSSFEAALAIEAFADFQIDANDDSQFDGRFNAAGIAAPTPLSGGPFSGPLVLSVVLDRTGSGTAEVFLADVPRGSVAYSVPVNTAATLIVMANRAKNAWLDGAVAELLVSGDVSNRTNHHSYLASKWGLT